MQWRRIGSVYFRWEVKAADMWLGSYGPEDKGGWRSYWLTIPPLGVPCVPLHIKWRHDKKAEPMPVRIFNQYMRPLHTGLWAIDGPEWAEMTHTQAVTLPSGNSYRVTQSGARLDLSPPEMYIMVHDERPIEQGKRPGMTAFADWEGFYDKHPEADPFSEPGNQDTGGRNSEGRYPLA